MKENKQHIQHIMLCTFKKGKNTKKQHTEKKICAVYGEGAVTDRMCQKCSGKFCAGDSSVDDAPRSGGPVEVDSNQIETLIENNQHFTTWEIVEYSKYPNHRLKIICTCLVMLIILMFGFHIN